MLVPFYCSLCLLGTRECANDGNDLHESHGENNGDTNLPAEIHLQLPDHSLGHDQDQDIEGQIEDGRQCVEGSSVAADAGDPSVPVLLDWRAVKLDGDDAANVEQGVEHNHDPACPPEEAPCALRYKDVNPLQQNGGLETHHGQTVEQRV